MNENEIKEEMRKICKDLVSFSNFLVSAEPVLREAVEKKIIGKVVIDNNLKKIKDYIRLLNNRIEKVTL